MALRTSLIIDGDASGAEAALKAAGVQFTRFEDEVKKTGHATGAASSQMMAMTHVARSMTEQIALGVSPMQALTAQMSHLSYIASAPGGLGAAFKSLGGLAAGVVTKFWPVVAVLGAAGVAFGGMEAEINRTAKTQVGFGDVVLATIQAISADIFNVLKPAIDGIAEWFGGIWDQVRPVLVEFGNNVIATFVASYNAVTETWALLPSAMGDIVISTFNGISTQVETFLNDNKTAIGSFVAQASQILGPFAPAGLAAGINLATSKITLPRLDNPFAGTAGKVGNIFGADFSADTAFGGAFGTDYLGQLFDDISTRAQKLAAESDKASKKTKAAAKDAKALDLGISGLDKSAKSLAQTLASSVSGAFSGLFTDLAHGKDLFSALRDEVGQLADQLINTFANQAFGSIFGSLFGGGTNLASAFSRGSGNFSIGNLATYASGTSYHPGGWALVGEEGPELLKLPRGSQVRSNADSIGAMGPPQFNVRIVNNTGAPVKATTSPDGSQLVLNLVDDALSKGRIGKGYARRYGLQQSTRRT